MLILDLKLVLFIVLVILSGAALAAWEFYRSRQRYGLGTTLESAPFGVVLLDEQQITYANGYARRAAGFAAVGRLPEAPWLELLAADRAAARSDATGAGRYRSVAFPGGGAVRWWVTSVGLRDLLVLLDATVHPDGEEAARYLLNDLAHELRTPMATILTHAEILALPDIAPEVQQQSQQLLKEETRRMARLVNDMLELGRLETGAEIALRPVDLMALAEGAVRQIQPQAEARAMTVTLEAGAELPLVLGDEDRLRQVLLNLLDNALKYSRSGDRVTVELQARAGGLYCAVRDSGPGIAARHLPHLTRRFYRAAPRGIEGSGLGLSLAAEILRRHGSRLEIESRVEPPSGTSVSFELQTEQ